MGNGADLESRLLGAIRTELRVEADVDTHLTALGLDSLRLAAFISDLERSFAFHADQDIFDVETVRDLARYVEQHRV